MTAPFFELREAAAELGGHTVLSGIDLAIGRGEAVALLGPSGAGKTSLLRLLNGTLRASRGAVLVDGQDLSRIPMSAVRSVRSRIGFVPQEHSLVPNLRVSQNVVAGALGKRGFWSNLRAMIWTGRDDLERAHALLERVGIAEKLFQRADELSGGERQRVALARALFQAPEALLADEPIAAVDPARARDVLERFTRLAREEGWALVASLHDLDLAREFFPRRIGLRAGRVMFDTAQGDVSREELEALYRLEEHS